MRKADITPEQLSLRFESSQLSSLGSVSTPTNVYAFVRHAPKSEKALEECSAKSEIRDEREIIEEVLSQAKTLGW